MSSPKRANDEVLCLRAMERKLADHPYQLERNLEIQPACNSN
jgi:hypothetical protein